MSNNQVAKFFIDLDVHRTGTSSEIKAKKFGDSVISNQAHRLSVLVFTGPKDAGARAFAEAGATMASPRSARKRFVPADTVDCLDEKTKKTLEKQLDIRYLMPSHMPQYLRVDKDVKEGLIKLSQMIKDYSNFDVLALDREVTRTMEIELDRQSADYKRHKRQLARQLGQAMERLELCIVSKDQIIQLRHEETRNMLVTYKSCQEFQQQESFDRVELQKQRELVIQADAQLRRAYNMNASAMMNSARLSNVEQQEKALQEERHHAVLRILQLALADINHHLQLIQSKNAIGEAELQSMQEYLTQILSQSKEAKQKYVMLEQNIRVNLDEYAKKASIFKDELRLITEQNRKLVASKEQ